MRTYTGTRAPDGCLVTVRDNNGIVQELPLRLDLRNHSPTGYVKFRVMRISRKFRIKSRTSGRVSST
jgi:hypothetical protein